MRVHIKTIIVLLASLVAFSSCHKERTISTDSSLKLSFSADTVCFDTVFTNIGTSTRQLIIYNNSNERLRISSARVLGGSSSAFTINIDGLSGNNLTDIEIGADDSLFVFVRATINPQDINNPYIVEDDIEFVTNGNIQTVKLLAYGQDAIYILPDTHIAGFPKFKIVADSLQTTVWSADRPYVIMGYAVIDSWGTLKIEAGTRIYIHKGGGIWSYCEGMLLVEGTRDNPVIIQGDRLDHYYDNIAGQWDRIWLMEPRISGPHHIEGAIIRNAFIGIQAESFKQPSMYPVIIKNTVIENCSGMGIYSVMFDINAENFIVANCGEYGIALTYGGSHSFTHGTIANFWNSARKTPSLFFTNFAKGNGTIYPNNFRADFGNCIIYGNAENEIGTAMISDADSNYIFKNCLVRSRIDTTSSVFSNCVFNKNPLFADYHNLDFHLDTIISPAIGKGLTEFAILVPDDLDGVARTANPDIGAYQFVEKQSRSKLW